MRRSRRMVSSRDSPESRLSRTGWPLFHPLHPPLFLSVCPAKLRVNPLAFTQTTSCLQHSISSSYTLPFNVVTAAHLTRFEVTGPFLQEALPCPFTWLPLTSRTLRPSPIKP
uniref:U1 small nuclear ribonucleoprotein A n=1 Tax=Pan troglodytes TaxID=9598 RepID=G2HJC0_PANTR|nr:U1 small nuclear ribonucleoprotein A [Pan troglodytes]